MILGLVRNGRPLLIPGAQRWKRPRSRETNERRPGAAEPTADRIRQNNEKKSLCQAWHGFVGAVPENTLLPGACSSNGVSPDKRLLLKYSDEYFGLETCRDRAGARSPAWRHIPISCSDCRSHRVTATISTLRPPMMAPAILQ